MTMSHGPVPSLLVGLILARVASFKVSMDLVQSWMIALSCTGFLALHKPVARSRQSPL